MLVSSTTPRASTALKLAGADLAFAVDGRDDAQDDLLLFAQLGRSNTRGVMPERGDGEHDNIFFKFHAASSRAPCVRPFAFA